MHKAQNENIKKYVIINRFGWISIFYNILLHYSLHIKIGLFIDILILFVIKKELNILITLLFWCILVTNHEFGHYIMAKKVVKNNLPIVLKIRKKRSYIVYSIAGCDDDDIVKVRFNAVKYDFLTICIAGTLQFANINFIVRSVIIFLGVTNLTNYFIWFKGSDGYVIKEYLKKYGVKKFLKTII